MIAAAEPIKISTAYGYVRVSRAFQAIGTSLDEQQSAISRYYAYALEAKGIQWGGFYQDTTSARIKPMSSRPQGSRIIQQLERGDHIVISKLDRAFRNCKDALTQIETWDKCGINPHLLDMPGQDLSSPAGRLTFTFLAAVAQFETDRRRERLASNKAYAYAQGLAFNHPPLMWKRVTDAEGKARLTLNPHHRLIAGKIVEWRKAGWGLHTITKHLRELDSRRSDGSHWSRECVRKAYKIEMWLQKVAEENGGTLPKDIMPPPWRWK